MSAIEKLSQQYIDCVGVSIFNIASRRHRGMWFSDAALLSTIVTLGDVHSRPRDGSVSEMVIPTYFSRHSSWCCFVHRGIRFQRTSSLLRCFYASGIPRLVVVSEESAPLLAWWNLISYTKLERTSLLINPFFCTLRGFL